MLANRIPIDDTLRIDASCRMAVLASQRVSGAFLIWFCLDHSKIVSLDASAWLDLPLAMSRPINSMNNDMAKFQAFLAKGKLLNSQKRHVQQVTVFCLASMQGQQFYLSQGQSEGAQLDLLL